MSASAAAAGSSERLQIVYEWRTITLTKPASTLVQSLLDEACATFKIADPAGFRLVVEKGSKPIDHALSLARAGIKPATGKLAIVAANAKRCNAVAVTVVWGEEQTNVEMALTASMWEVLQSAEQKRQKSAAGADAAASSSSAAASPAAPAAVAASSSDRSMTGWRGIPAPEVNAQFEVHINVPGWMRPVVELPGGRKLSGGESELRAVTLRSLGLASDTAQPSKLRLKLSHSYEAPQRSEAEQKEVMENFQRKYQAMMGGIGLGAPAAASPAASSSSTAASHAKPHVNFSDPAMDDADDIDVDSDSDSPVAPLSIPADRSLKLLHALPGMLPAASLPEEWYEVTDEDSFAYAKSIRREAARMRQMHGGSAAPATDLPLDAEAIPAVASQELNPAFAPRADAADAASSSSSAATAAPAPLLDSARLPPVPSRSSRLKRRTVATLLRVRLPSHLYAEALFRTEETPADLYRFLDSLMAEQGQTDWYLYITPPRQQLSRTSKLTFSQLGLIPQAIVHFGREGAREQAHAAGSYVAPTTSAEEGERNPAIGLLKPEWVSKVQRILPPPPLPPQQSSEEEEKKGGAMDVSSPPPAAATAAPVETKQEASPNAMD